MQRLGENVTLNLKNKSHAVTAEVWLPEKGATGVLITQGGQFGGWSLYVGDSVLKYCYNLLGVQRFYTTANTLLPAEQAQVRIEVSYDGGGLGDSVAPLPCFWTAAELGEGHIELYQPLSFHGADSLDVGCETGTMVAEDLDNRHSKFNGKIRMDPTQPGH